MNDNTPIPLTLNLKGRLYALDRPLVVGILNATPDSFYSASRCDSNSEIAARAQQIVEEGGDIIDIGAYSSRPSATHISEQEEMSRLANALEIVKNLYPNIPISVDTFRAEIARRCVEKFGVAMINDISGGELDPNMFATVAKLHVPYILMHMRGTPQTMQKETHYDHLVADVMRYFASKIDQLTLLGVNDIVLDLGFGFSKTTAQNYTLLQALDQFAHFGLPILTGISRKSMIYKPLDSTPAEALNGTTVLNTIALTKGTQLLRVHDVRQAVECVTLVMATQKPETLAL